MSKKSITFATVNNLSSGMKTKKLYPHPFLQIVRGYRIVRQGFRPPLEHYRTVRQGT